MVDFNKHYFSEMNDPINFVELVWRSKLDQFQVINMLRTFKQAMTLRRNYITEATFKELNSLTKFMPQVKESKKRMIKGALESLLKGVKVVPDYQVKY